MHFIKFYSGVDIYNIVMTTTSLSKRTVKPILVAKNLKIIKDLILKKCKTDKKKKIPIFVNFQNRFNVSIIV